MTAAEGGQSLVSGPVHILRNHVLSTTSAPCTPWGTGGLTRRMLGCGPEAGSGGGGGVFWGGQSASGPSKTEMLNGPFPEGKL